MSTSQYLWNLVDFAYQVYVQFPVGALTIPRQLPMPQPPKESEAMAVANGTGAPRRVSDRIYDLCRSAESVSAALAKDPSIAPGDAWKRIYGHHSSKESGSDSSSDTGEDDTAGDGQGGTLKRAAECGKWGPTQPSEFFLQVCPTYSRQ